jgi:adenine-specific DNA-methyltransferase
LKSIATNEPPIEEVLVDRPETDEGITRVSGPFVVEAMLPTPQPLDLNNKDGSHGVVC